MLHSLLYNESAINQQTGMQAKEKILLKNNLRNSVDVIVSSAVVLSCTNDAVTFSLDPETVTSYDPDVGRPAVVADASLFPIICLSRGDRNCDAPLASAGSLFSPSIIDPTGLDSFSVDCTQNKLGSRL